MRMTMMQFRRSGWRLVLGGCVAAACVSAADEPALPTPVRFPSGDGVEITADLYPIGGAPGGRAPVIVMFHQAGYSRGEYREIAPRLAARGYRCLAVDLRSGREVNGVLNETTVRAAREGKSTRYVDAKGDMEAALKYARETYGPGPLIVWGSSYSAALAIRVAGEGPRLVDGVVSFSPGEYFAKQGMSGTWIEEAAPNVRCPVFLASAANETKAWRGIWAALGTKEKVSYVPKDTPGIHGSRALWTATPDHAGYRDALDAFLTKYFPVAERE